MVLLSRQRGWLFAIFLSVATALHSTNGRSQDPFTPGEAPPDSSQADSDLTGPPDENSQPSPQPDLQSMGVLTKEAERREKEFLDTDFKKLPSDPKEAYLYAL